MRSQTSLFSTLILVVATLSGMALGGCGQPSLSTPPPTAVATTAPTDAPEATGAPPTATVTPLPTAETPPPTKTLETPQEEESPVPFEIASDAFAAQTSIPEDYTCDGEDISPPLSWSAPPPGTQSFALICDDPDAPGGTWVHWILFNIPGDSRSLPTNIPAQDRLVDGSVHGMNSWQRLDYGGPCPPRGTHRYFFKLYALDAQLPLDAGATSEDLTIAMQNHILANAELVGHYGR